MNKRTTFFIIAVILVLSLIAGIVINYVIDKVGKNEKLNINPKKQQKPDIANNNNINISKKPINDVKSPNIKDSENITEKQSGEENKIRKRMNKKKKVKPMVDKQNDIKDIQKVDTQEIGDDDDDEHKKLEQKRLWNPDIKIDREEEKKPFQSEEEERIQRNECITKDLENQERMFAEEVKLEQQKSNESERFRNKDIDLLKETEEEKWNNLEKKIESQPEIYKNQLIINKKGIKNEGNTCYASSLFQCLNSLKCLREYLFELNVENKPFTKTIKQILYKLMEPGTTSISIKRELNYIISSPIAKSDLKIGDVGDTVDLYDKIITSLIIESSNISFNNPIFSDRSFFNLLKNKKNFLIDNFLIHRTENYETSLFCEYSPYIRLVYNDNEINLLEEPLKSFEKDYKVISSNNKIIVILLEFSKSKVKNLEVPRELEYGEKIYHLRSFCTNLPGSIGHYYATVRDKQDYIIFNDTKVEVRNEEVLRSNGLVRLIFYETE